MPRDGQKHSIPDLLQHVSCLVGAALPLRVLTVDSFALSHTLPDAAWPWPAGDSWPLCWPRSAPAWALTRQLGQWSPCWWLQAAFRTGLKLPSPPPTSPTVRLTSYLR